MKLISRISAILLTVIVAFYGCDKNDSAFRDDYLQGHEINYKGMPDSIGYSAGKNRVQLYWTPSPDQTVTKYVIYWNDKHDSLVVPAITDRSKTMEVMINNLQEYSYTFVVQSIDDKGNRSIPHEIANVRSYGSLYESYLVNRYYDNANPYVVASDGSVTLNFLKPDTINIVTEIKYMNTAGQMATAKLTADNSSIKISDFKFGSGVPVTYRSSYIPLQGSLDTVFAPATTTFPEIYRLIECSKSLFRGFAYNNGSPDNRLAGDAKDAPYGGTDGQLSYAYDGQRPSGGKSWPQIFHSNGANNMPATISLDLGAEYTNLWQVEEIGRNCCDGNPMQFEIWGIGNVDLTNSAYKPTEDSKSANWESDMTAKGWTKILSAQRGDDGQSAMKFDIIRNIPPVRYVRFRCLRNGGGGEFYVGQLTFWYKQ